MTPLKILLIEDDALTAADLTAQLEDAGHTVVGSARDAAEARKLLKAMPPDLAIIDIILNGTPLAGIQLAQDLLAQHWMPFLYLTSSSEQATMDKASPTLPSAYLLKPFRIKELLVQIDLAHANFLRLEPGLPSGGRVLFLPIDNGHEQILPQEVLYLRAEGASVAIHVRGRKRPATVWMNLGKLLKRFEDPHLFRLSRSLVVNLTQIRRVERNAVHLGDERVTVEISEANRKTLLQRIQVVKTK